MTEQYQYYDKTITLSTQASDQGINWWVEVPQDDGSVMHYQLTWPIPDAGKIRVVYTPSKVFPDGATQMFPSDRYYEANFLYFYNMVVDGQAYGEFAAQQAINGLVARLPQLGGSKENPLLGHRVYTDGVLRQPVIFELVDIQAESAAGASDGGFRVQIINGTEPYKWKLSQDAHWRTADHTYDDLSEGVYQVEVEDAAGDTRTEKVYVPLNVI